MHLQIVLAFALLLWWPEQTPSYALVTAALPSVLVVVGQLAVVFAATAFLSVYTRRRLRQAPGRAQPILTFYHRTTFLLRVLLLGITACDLFMTAWPQVLTRQSWLAAVPGLPQLAALSPYVLGLIGVWWIVYPVEQAARAQARSATRSSRIRYVVFNVRHQILVVALPLAIIVVTYAATDEHRAYFVRRLHSPWGPEAVLTVVAVGLFILAPVILRRIWATSPLPDGPLRRRLLALCGRINLRVREILVWHSDGMVVNAAVMGLFPRVRYIMLSDALLDSMSEEEIEAVFGHEAGHVRHHHIPYFLLFALLSMLVCSGVMELLLRLGQGPRPVWRLGPEVIQALGLAAVIPLWGIAFGWISRRFERQADLFGARCAAAAAGEVNCRSACAVHDPGSAAVAVPRYAVCTGGAGIFVRALRKVAILNGIPAEERSWRHSSIASRMMFLAAMSGDPSLTRRFLRTIGRIKLALIGLDLTGLIIAGAYIWQHPGYRRAVNTSIIEPLRQIFL